MRSLFALVLALAAAPALADDTCHVEAGPHDVVKKSGDVIIEAGQVVEDAIAVDGKVILKKGAVVKSAVAFHGDVVIEDGAKVTKSALSIGGAVKVAKGAVVNSTIEISDKGLRVHGEDGDDVDVNIVIGGKSLGQRIADEALSKMKDCKIVAKK
jgi:UDP-3-O-[3-hydroxymyristoyl] glucosamine N-acyltransferase